MSKLGAELVIVGPEAPLVAGAAGDAGIPVCGPSR
ncbi:phosphoribosylamine--glycine ligase family protein [Streptomyces sp. NBC_00015]|nr:phosphoribosylamine--glycine ligase family protein [Streptomyces sp. NBC_00103]